VTGILGALEDVWIVQAATGGYVAVYLLEITLLLVTLVAIIPLLRARARAARAAEPAEALGDGALAAGHEQGTRLA